MPTPAECPAVVSGPSSKTLQMSRIERLAAARRRIGGRPLGVATRGRRYGLRGRCAHRRLEFCLTLVVSRSDWR
jgi:hypothetical protein